MAEWQIYRRAQLQKKMKKNQNRREQERRKSDASKDSNTPKKDHMFIMIEQNSIMSEAIAEIQEKLNDVRAIMSLCE